MTMKGTRQAMMRMISNKRKRNKNVDEDDTEDDGYLNHRNDYDGYISSAKIKCTKLFE